MPLNPFDGGKQPQVPNSAVLGPDNNLWVGFKLNGAIVRVNNPSQPVPTTTGRLRYLCAGGWNYSR